jgi:hypothetical protein
MGKLNQALLAWVLFALFGFWMLYQFAEGMKQSGALAAIQ